MSTTCPQCNKAIKVEDVLVKSYLPVNDLQTCGAIKVTRRGRVAARNIQSGGDIDCQGTMEGAIETDSGVTLGSKSSWKGKTLQSRSLAIALGAKLNGVVTVPWDRDGALEPVVRPTRTVKKKAVAKKKTSAIAKKKTSKKTTIGKKSVAKKKTTTTKKTTKKKTSMKKPPSRK
jgi:hypothetical protein